MSQSSANCKHVKSSHHLPRTMTKLFRVEFHRYLDYVYDYGVLNPVFVMPPLSDCHLSHRSSALSAPREDGRMAPTGSLTFNDAPWLSTGLLNKEAVQFVHGSIDADFGTCVGVCVRWRRIQFFLANMKKCITHFLPHATIIVLGRD